MDMCSIRFVIWGAGIKGGELADNIVEKVCAFIDSNKEKQGRCFKDRPVICIEDYISYYSDCYIILSMQNPEACLGVEDELVKRGIYRFFRLSDTPMQFRKSFSKHKWKDLSFPFDGNKRNVIIGITASSMCLYEKYRNTFEICFVCQKGIRRELRNIISSDFPGVNIIDENSIKEQDQVFLATLDSELNGVDLIDLSWMKEYHNGKMNELRGLLTGKRCFIIGNGPSLKMEDLDRIQNNGDFSIGTNSIFVAFKKTRWRPSVYLSVDYHQTEIYADEILGMEVPIKVIGDIDGLFWENNDCNSLYKLHVQEYIAKFSEDFSSGVYINGTVTYGAIQLAVYMDCKEIYLLGVDCDYSVNEGKMPYFSQDYTNKTELKYDIERNFVQNGKTMEYYQEMDYLLAKEYANKHAIVIKNATRGGKLEIFERVDFDSLFDD